VRVSWGYTATFSRSGQSNSKGMGRRIMLGQSMPPWDLMTALKKGLSGFRIVNQARMLVTSSRMVNLAKMLVTLSGSPAGEHDADGASPAKRTTGGDNLFEHFGLCTSHR